MLTITCLADHRPLLFVLLTMLAWIFFGGVLASAAAVVAGSPLTGAYPQIVGTLGSKLFLLTIVGRLGWLASIGITRFGVWSSWAAKILPATLDAPPIEIWRSPC